MMTRIQMLRKAAALLSNPKTMGDGAVLKADAVGARVSPELAEALEPVRGYLPVIELDRLRSLPEGTLGHAYAVYMDQNHLAPIQVSAEYRYLAERNVFAVRYAVTHDIFHLLLGFDTTLPGEIGVLAFAVAQGYSRVQAISLVLALILYSLRVPWQIGRIVSNVRRGYAMGRRAGFLLARRFEDEWDRELSGLRSELRLA
jgi:ubiquinone biosynthesis protein COQ4